MYNEKRVEDGHEPTAVSFILVQRQPRMVDFGMGRSWSVISDDHTVQKKILTTFWTKRREDVLRLLQMFLPPTENFAYSAVQHIRQARPRLAGTGGPSVVSSRNFWTVGSRIYGLPAPVRTALFSNFTIWGWPAMIPTCYTHNGLPDLTLPEPHDLLR